MAPSKKTNLKKIQAALLDARRPVLMQPEFHTLLKDNKAEDATLTRVKTDLLEAGLVKKVTLKSEGYKDVDRYCIPALQPSPYHYALSLRGQAYLCHASAMNILGLTEQIPKIIYANKEQGPKKKSLSELTQEGIDRAFANQQRRSKYIFKIDGYQIILLSGKSTGNLGVVHDAAAGLLHTDLERTLIDITVRPRYAGGVFQVLEAYKSALHAVDCGKLSRYLKAMEYTYPYHQAVGFYLERAGAGAAELGLFKESGLAFDFYLDYSLTSPDYDKSWRIHFPRGI